MTEVLEKPVDVKPTKAKSKMFKVTIHSGEDKGDKGDVVLVHNYRQILIQRDKEVTISEEYLNVLKDSVIHTVSKTEDNKEVQIKIPRFAFSVEAA